MTATTCSGYGESTVVTVDEGCTANHSTPPEMLVLRFGRALVQRHTNFVMNTKVAAAFAIVISGLAGAYSLFVPPDRKPPSAADSAARGPIDARSDALAREIARLQRHQEPGVAPARGRDVFRFAVARAARPERAVPLVPPAPEPPVAPPRPALKLIGVAEDTASGTPVRTAIISTPDQLYVVREGEHVTSRFGVQRISPDVVELVDNVDASALRLALK